MFVMHWKYNINCEAHKHMYNHDQAKLQPNNIDANNSISTQSVDGKSGGFLLLLLYRIGGAHLLFGGGKTATHIVFISFRILVYYIALTCYKPYKTHQIPTPPFLVNFVLSRRIILFLFFVFVGHNGKYCLKLVRDSLNFVGLIHRNPVVFRGIKFCGVIFKQYEPE